MSPSLWFFESKNDIHMKTSFYPKRSTKLTKSLFVSLFMLSSLLLWSLPEKNNDSPAVVFSNLSGDIWVETDGNGAYNGESGPSDVLVFLYDSDQDTIVAQTLSVSGKYEFNSVPPGKYYLRIDKSAFDFGGSLIGLQSCPGANDANDMVDNDDNGSDTAPLDVLCSPFDLTNADPMSDVSVDYIDFCFFAACDEQNPFATQTCDQILDVDVFCNMEDLGNLCATMPIDSTPGVQPMPLCDGFSNSENISWLGFIAAGGSYDLTITAFDCPTGGLGQQGIQVGLYTDCSFEEAAFCSFICSEGPISISSGFLTPGQVYYMYINGCNGNVCSYQIDVTGSPETPSLDPGNVCVLTQGGLLCEDLSYCPNSDIVIEARDVDIIGRYNWEITTISGDPYTGDPVPITETNQIIINIPTDGEYEVCLTKVENVCDDQAWSGSLCRNIKIDSTIPMPQDEDFGEAFVCEDDIDLFTVAVFNNEDPNGDGDLGWNALLPDYILGVNQGIVYTEGCSYKQQFKLSTFDPSPVEDVLISVCEEDLPITIDDLTFSTFSFGGQSTIVFENLLLQTVQDQNGCDSIINLTLEKLNILQGQILEPVCTVDGINLEFNYISDLSTDITFLDFTWYDPSANVIPHGADPTTVLAPFESGDGEYTLEVVINKNGETCLYSYSVFVEIDIYLPPTPTITGPNIVCEGDALVTYLAQGNGEESAFVWSVPNDVASFTISGDVDEIITIDWSGSNGGDIVVIGQNGCGQSNPFSYEVQIIPKTTPNFNIDTSVCLNNATSIDFIGTGINISDYTWSFDGGVVMSGSGMGPYEVSWSDEGEKTVTLFTTDNNGCTSNLTEKSILVKAPLTPTEVSCVPSVGEILFLWEIPVGVSGFEVNVLSGQSGGVFSATSFLMPGLGEGEEVTIELLTMPEDPICGEFVSTIISCTALECVPPEIVLVAEQSACVDGDEITVEATITSGETGVGIFTGPGIVDATNGVFDPALANIGINTILYTFTSDVADCVGSKTISIEVFELPVASFIQDVDTICITDQVNLSYSGTVNAETFDWNYDGGVGSGLLTNPTVTFSTPGIKNISLQVTKNGCVSNIATSTVLVEPELEGFDIRCDTVGTSFVTFAWDAVPGVTLYQVTVGNDPPFFTQNTTLTIEGLEEEQTVTILVTSVSTTKCPGSTEEFFCNTTKTPVSVHDNILSNIKLYPNPASDQVLFDGVVDNNVTYRIYNVVGETVKSGQLAERKIDLTLMTKGIYIIRLADLKQGLFKDFKIVKD